MTWSNDGGAVNESESVLKDQDVEAMRRVPSAQIHQPR